MTGENKHFKADFVSVQADIDSLAISQGDVKTADDGTVVIDLGAATTSYSEPKITVKGLPSGLKYDAKTQKVSGQAKKPGVYTVTVTATNASQKKATPKSTVVFEVVVPNFTSDKLPNLLQDPDAYGTIWCGVAFNSALVNCTPASGWTVKASGLPTGLKWATKAVVDSKTGAIVALPNTIYGVPTKAGNYTVTFTATSGKEKQVATITLKVSALPTWAVGTFNGGKVQEDIKGQTTLTIASNGKISGKYLTGGLTATLSANSFSSCVGSLYAATNLTVKVGKSTSTWTLFVNFEEYAEGMTVGYAWLVNETGDYVADLWQTDWKAEPWKTVVKSVGYKAVIDWDYYCYHPNMELKLRFSANGSVKVTGRFFGDIPEYKGTGSATFIPRTAPDRTKGWAFDGVVYIYIPPKAGKFEKGCYECINVKWDGSSRFAFEGWN